MSSVSASATGAIGTGDDEAVMLVNIDKSASTGGDITALEVLSTMGGAKTTELRVDCGAMKSEIWAQIFADITEKKILVSENKDGAAMGAAILGFLGLKRYNTIEKAIENMIRFPTFKNPNKENSRIYKKLYRIFLPTLLEIYSKKRVTKDL